MASITTIKNKDGTTSWRVNWRVGAGKDRQPETQTFRTYKDAREHRNAMDAQEQRRVGSSKRITVFEYLDQWIADKTADRKNPISPKTAEGYLRNITILKRGLKKDRLLSQLDKQHLDRAYDELLVSGKLLRGGVTGPLTKQSVLHVHRLIHKALNDAVDNKLITANPAGRAEAPRVQGKGYKTRVRSFTKAEIVLLFARAQDPICDPETYPMAACLAITGLRRGELAGLADDAIDWENGVISVFRNVVAVGGEPVVKETKTEAGRRKLRIPAELVALLREQRTRVLETALAWGRDYQKKPLYLFPGVGGGPMHPNLITHRMMRLIARAGIVPGEGKQISPVHSFRHTTGTMLWGAFKDAKQIQAQLGHSTPAISMALYVESSVEAEDEAATFLGGLIRGV